MRIENNYRVEMCPFCGSERISKTGNLNYIDRVEFSTHFIDLTSTPEIWECLICHSSFTQNAIHPEKAEELYATGEGSKRWSPQSFEEDKTAVVKECLKKYLDRKNLKILDVGCNTGEFLDYVKGDGRNTYGLELCEESCKILSLKGHVAFRTGKEINETFDVITAFDVFEHVYDPNGFLSFIGSLLNENGIFILLTGNPSSVPAQKSKENWWYFNYPEHVIFPSPVYFQELKIFRLLETINVFASISHEGNRRDSGIKNIIKSFFAQNKTGRPTTIADHQLVVLQKYN